MSPGQCSYSVYWVPSSNPWTFGPEQCNETGGEGVYISWIDDIDFSGPGTICASVIGFSGKPCDEIY